MVVNKFFWRKTGSPGHPSTLTLKQLQEHNGQCQSLPQKQDILLALHLLQLLEILSHFPLSQALDLVYHQSNEGRHYQHHTQLTSTSSEVGLMVHDKGEGLVECHSL